MIVGYARTSSLSQVAGLEAQIRDLQAVGCTKIFQEQVSSVVERQQLETALDFVREGDQFVVTKLDRLARSVADLLAIVARLEAKQVSLRVLSISGNQPLDTNTSTGRLISASSRLWDKPKGRGCLSANVKESARPKLMGATRAGCRPLGDRLVRSLD